MLRFCWNLLDYEMNAKGPHRWQVNIGSGNGLVLSGNKPLPEPMLTQFHVTIWHHQATTRITRTLAFWWYPPPPHDYPYYWFILDPKSKEDKVTNYKFTNKSYKFKEFAKILFFSFWDKHFTGHTFCLIRCANMKWIWQVLLKIKSRHDSVHRRTDGQTDRRTDGRTDGQGETSIPPFRLRWS